MKNTKEEAIKTKDNKKKKKYKSFCCEDCHKISEMQLFIGLTFFLLGIFYLGRTLNLWSFTLDWNITWPVLIILFGLAILGGRQAVKWLLWILFLFFIALISATIVFFFQKDLNETNYVNRPNLIYAQVNKSHVSINHCFSGSFNREELEDKIGETLDLVYEDKEEDSVDIVLSIRRR